MALPKQVQQQLEHAESLLASANAPAQEPAAPPPVAPVAEAPAVEPPAVAPEPAPAAQAPEPAPKAEDWQHKYKTLQGIHNRHVSDLKDQVSQLSTRLNEVLQRTEQAKPADKPAAPQFDPKDVETFGSDLVEMVRRVAETSFGGAAQAFEARLQRIEQHIQGTSATVAKTAEQVFLDQLERIVPDYKEINVDDGFLAWLAEEDPVYGVPRQNALTAAAQSGDAGRTAAIFNAFKALRAPAPAPTPKPSAQLEKQVAPRAASSGQPAADPRRTYTVAEVESFYRDVAQGRFRGRDEEVARIEAVFNNALSEGRIVNAMPRTAPV